MTNLRFVGVGDAFDPALGNTSLLLESDQTLLIDCGYAAAAKLFALNLNNNAIDAIYLTHYHLDHSFGVAPVLDKWDKEGRTKPLTLIGQPGLREQITGLLHLGLVDVQPLFGYKVNYRESVEPFALGRLKLRFAETAHAVRNFAIRVDGPNFSFAHSGDGNYTKASKALFSGVQLLVHEAYLPDTEELGHTTAEDVLAMASELEGLNTLALTHLSRFERTAMQKRYDGTLLPPATQVIVPEPGKVLSL